MTNDKHASGAMARENAIEPRAVCDANGRRWRVECGDWTMQPAGMISAEQARTVCEITAAALSAISTPEAQREGCPVSISGVGEQIDAAMDELEAHHPVSAMTHLEEAKARLDRLAGPRPEAQREGSEKRAEALVDAYGKAERNLTLAANDAGPEEYDQCIRVCNDAKQKLLASLRPEAQREGLAGRLVELSAIKQAIRDFKFDHDERGGIVFGPVTVERLTASIAAALALHTTSQPEGGDPVRDAIWLVAREVQELNPGSSCLLEVEAALRAAAPQPPLPSGAPDALAALRNLCDAWDGSNNGGIHRGNITKSHADARAAIAQAEAGTSITVAGSEDPHGTMFCRQPDDTWLMRNSSGQWVTVPPFTAAGTSGTSGDRIQKLIREGKEWRDMYVAVADERDRLIIALAQLQGAPPPKGDQ